MLNKKEYNNAYLTGDRALFQSEGLRIVDSIFGGYQNTEELKQSLADAGCDKDTIDSILSCIQSGNKAESLVQLEKQRSLLLGNIHEEQASIEYLDRLLYELKGQAK